MQLVAGFSRTGNRALTHRGVNCLYIIEERRRLAVTSVFLDLSRLKCVARTHLPDDELSVFCNCARLLINTTYVHCG